MRTSVLIAKGWSALNYTETNQDQQAHSTRNRILVLSQARLLGSTPPCVFLSILIANLIVKSVLPHRTQSQKSRHSHSKNVVIQDANYLRALFHLVLLPEIFHRR
jgi:hypothetical protein